MARENQGLQVLVIIFVMISVVLGVFVYVYVKKVDDATKAVAAANTAKQTAEKATDDVQKENVVLKTLIGLPDRSTPDIQKQFTDDMETYGNQPKSDDPTKVDDKLFKTETLYYNRLLASMFKVIQDRNGELADTRAQVAQYGRELATREGAKEASIQKLNAGYQIVADSSKVTNEAMNTALLTTNAEVARSTNQVTVIRSDATKKVEVAAETVKTAQNQVAATETDLRKVTKILNEKERGTINVPSSGEIVWVSVPLKTVWINRGQSDYLQRGTKFIVYSADSTNAAKAVKKGNVEVSKILGAHSAEARIVDDQLTDPITSGDKVFTPLWSPGQQNHFALAGIMNLDGDGVNQVNVVRGMIAQNGGVVDCELSESGQMVGAVKPTTRYLIEGDPPDKSTPEAIKNNTEIRDAAGRYSIQKMPLSDFKQMMGYQKSSSVEHFGSSSPSNMSGSGTPSPRPAPKPKAAAGSVDAGG